MSWLLAVMGRSSPLLLVGSILAVAQFLMGAANRLIGPVFLIIHITLAVVLLALLILTLYSQRGVRRVMRHTLITVVILLVQGAVGLDLFMRGGVNPVGELLHWIFGAATAGSYVGILAIHYRRQHTETTA